MVVPLQQVLGSCGWPQLQVHTRRHGSLCLASHKCHCGLWQRFTPLSLSGYFTMHTWGQQALFKPCRVALLTLCDMQWMCVVLVVVLNLTPWTCFDFCYDDGQCDPYTWGDMYPSCYPLLDLHHSPIDLGEQQVHTSSLGALDLHGFDSTPKVLWTLHNQGNSVVLEVGRDVYVSGGGLPSTYRTTQLHFHWGSASTNGSEHTILQHRFPMEVWPHNTAPSVHKHTISLQDPTGLAVLAVFIDLVHVDNEHFQPISDALPFVTYKGQAKSIKPFPLLSLLPQSNLSQYYRYHGSLTTPPCSQAVLWTVYEVPISISWAQFEPFINQIYKTQEGVENKVLLHNNFRPIQPTYSAVYASKEAQPLQPVASASSRPAIQFLLLCGLTHARIIIP